MRQINQATIIESENVETFENNILVDDGMISWVVTEDSYSIVLEGEEHDMLCER